MNIAIINIRDIIRYLIRITIIICIIVILINFLKGINIKKEEENIKETIYTTTKQISQYSFLSCLDTTISLMSYSKENKEKEKISIMNKILGLELGVIDNAISKNSDLQIDKQELTIDDTEELIAQTESLTDILTNITTEAVEENNIPATYTNSYNSVEIKNQSDYGLTEEMLIPNTEITNTKEIVIYHTHTCESYTPSENYYYEMTGNYRTTDLNYTVAKVGTELTNFLKNKGFEIEHNTTYHDYPAYSGSYSRSLTTVENLLQGKDTQIVFDLHRDAVGSSNEYAPTVKINGEYAAQLMFVIRNRRRGIRTS